MFEFLKKKPVAAPPPKPGQRATEDPGAEPPARSGWSPDDLAQAFTDFQVEKAARLEAEKAQAREIDRD